MKVRRIAREAAGRGHEEAPNVKPIARPRAEIDPLVTLIKEDRPMIQFAPSARFGNSRQGRSMTPSTAHLERETCSGSLEQGTPAPVREADQTINGWRVRADLWMRLDVRPLKVFICLTKVCGADGTVSCPQSELASRTGSVRSTVILALARLQRDGLIELIEPGIGRQTAIYQITCPRASAVTDSPRSSELPPIPASTPVAPAVVHGRSQSSEDQTSEVRPTAPQRSEASDLRGVNAVTARASAPSESSQSNPEGKPSSSKSGLAAAAAGCSSLSSKNPDYRQIRELLMCFGVTGAKLEKLSSSPYLKIHRVRSQIDYCRERGKRAGALIQNLEAIADGEHDRTERLRATRQPLVEPSHDEKAVSGECEARSRTPDSKRDMRLVAMNLAELIALAEDTLRCTSPGHQKYFEQKAWRHAPLENPRLRALMGMRLDENELGEGAAGLIATAASA